MASQVEGIKWVPRTTFLVDGFNFQSPKCQAYFLTHFHSDHTTGLTKGFCRGTIYCSAVTAALLTEDMGLSPQFVRVLPMDKEVSVLGIPVVLLDANHCPGAVMILFKVPGTVEGVPEAILHTGDCRWQPWMAERVRPHLHDCGSRVGTLLLDTTYCLPRHVHPPQQVAIDALVAQMRQELKYEPDTLFVIAAYHIGKERVFLGAARQLGVKVYCPPAKRRVLSLLNLPAADLALLTEDEAEAPIHVTNWGMRPEALQRHIDQGNGRWKAVLGVKATGWTLRRKPGLHVWRQGPTALVGVPYSEHSSFTELRECVRALRPRRLVPTVNAADASRSRNIVDRFADLMDISQDRTRLDWYLWRKGGVAVSGAKAPCVASPDCTKSSSASTNSTVLHVAEEGGNEARSCWRCAGDGIAGNKEACSDSKAEELAVLLINVKPQPEYPLPHSTSLQSLFNSGGRQILLGQRQVIKSMYEDTVAEQASSVSKYVDIQGAVARSGADSNATQVAAVAQHCAVPPLGGVTNTHAGAMPGTFGCSSTRTLEATVSSEAHLWCTCSTPTGLGGALPLAVLLQAQPGVLGLAAGSSKRGCSPSCIDLTADCSDEEKLSDAEANGKGLSFGDKSPGNMPTCYVGGDRTLASGTGAGNELSGVDLLEQQRLWDSLCKQHTRGAPSGQDTPASGRNGAAAPGLKRRASAVTSAQLQVKRSCSVPIKLEAVDNGRTHSQQVAGSGTRSGIKGQCSIQQFFKRSA